MQIIPGEKIKFGKQCDMFKIIDKQLKKANKKRNIRK